MVSLGRLRHSANYRAITILSAKVHPRPLAYNVCQASGIQTICSKKEPPGEQNDLLYSTALVRRIYVLGLDNLGKLVSYSLTDIPNPPPITLLLNGSGQLLEWKRHGESIELVTRGVLEKRQGFDVELRVHSGRRVTPTHPNNDTIYNLIVSVSHSRVVQVLQTVAHRLCSESTITFLQNIASVLDDVNEEVFPDPQQRPSYLLCTSTHAFHGDNFSFTAFHAGVGVMKFGLLSCHHQKIRGRQLKLRELRKESPSCQYLLRTLTRVPRLAAVGIPSTDILMMQLESLAIEAITSPMTVIFGCERWEFDQNIAIMRFMRLLVSEISCVLRSLPEVKDFPNVGTRFSSKRLEIIVRSIFINTSLNDGIAMQSIRMRTLADIVVTNRYFIRRGEQLGIVCVTNYAIVQMMKGTSYQHTNSRTM